jgi:hypothetical protein
LLSSRREKIGGLKQKRHPKVPFCSACKKPIKASWQVLALLLVQERPLRARVLLQALLPLLA